MTVIEQEPLFGPATIHTRPTMRVRKRDGDLEPVDVTRIVAAVQRCAGDLTEVDPLRVATKTISGLYDGATTAELDRLSIQTAAELIGEEPQYSRLAARLLIAYADAEVAWAGDLVVQLRYRLRPPRRADRRRYRRVRGSARRPAGRGDRFTR